MLSTPATTRRAETSEGRDLCPTVMLLLTARFGQVKKGLWRVKDGQSCAKSLAHMPRCE